MEDWEIRYKAIEWIDSVQASQVDYIKGKVDWLAHEDHRNYIAEKIVDWIRENFKEISQ